MAVRSLILMTLLVLLTASLSQACFGPKLFVGAGQGAQSDVLFALVTLYVQEKTGVESTRVEIEEGQNPLDLLSSEKADLVLVPANESPDGVIFYENAVFHIDGLLQLVTGKRPLDDLQFTTVLPAIRKLNRLLKFEDVAWLVSRVDAGESAMAVVRKFFMERRWI